MKKMVVDVLGNFGEYKNIVLPTTGRKQDEKEICEKYINAVYNDTIVACKIWGRSEDKEK